MPDGVTYSEEFSARAVLDEYLDYDMPFGYFLPNDGYGAGYGQNGYNMTGGVNADGSSSEERLAAVAANVQNLKEFADYAAGKGVATGLWTQSNLTPDSNANTYWHTLRDFNAEVNAGVTTLKTDVAWVGYGYSFQLSGVKQAYDIITENQSTRPNIISLDGWAGSQRYNGVWTGDQTGGNWEYIRFHIPTFIGQSLSGNPNIGSDMDGIWGGTPLIATRDYQWKSFAPLMLDMDGWGSYAKGPYVHGDPYTGISRMYLKMKAMMMPYTYTNAYAAANLETGNDDKGLPMIRAMFLEYPDEAYAYTEAGSQYQYMWGENLLVAPVYQDTNIDEMGNDVRDGIYLPGGEDQIWIDYLTGEKYEGGQVINNFAAPKYDIMGPFICIPGMQCRHSVYSMKHAVKGWLSLNQEKIVFQKGLGYMEGDSGTSFPDKYIWTQHFLPGGSIMIAAASIPLAGMHFTGCVGFLYRNKKEYRFATYLGASVKRMGENELLIRQGRYRLHVKFQKSGGNILHAPDNGKMIRKVREDVACQAEYTLTYGKHTLLHVTTNKAAAEYAAR